MSVVTIGNFDGVHLGHQEILRTTLDQAAADGVPSVAFTFRPHPQSVLRPDRAPELLLTYDEKRERLMELGIQRVVEQPFSLEFAKTPPSEFFSLTLRGALGARAVVVGYDFTFGRERTGHLQVLQSLCDAAGVRLTVVAPQRVDQEVVSSSAIRAWLRQGQLREATRGLGRPFFYSGPVVKGDRRGRLLGFPTANLALGEKLVLSVGVYATRTRMEGSCYASVTNVGVRPTFGGSSAVLAETHLLEGSWGPDSLYGRSMRVEFIERIRDEKRFSGVEELASQIAADSARARQILGAR
jgi:riboflavin kinase/FMN adenylyltransferase